MRKYRPSLTDYENEKLKELSEKDFSNHNETEVREWFIVPLLDLLGYRKNSDYDVSSEESYNLNPLFLQPGSKKRRMKLDYICSVRKSKFWIIEAKSGYKNKPGNKSTIGEKDIDQAYFYSLHPSINCPYFLVTNGWQINLYKRDELGEDHKPILSISSDSLPNRFLELDSYMGATQILPFLKRSILDDTKKVLSAEVYLDRLDEFVKEIEGAVGSIRPAVLDNFRKNAEIQERKGREDFKNLIDQESLHLIPTSVFSYVGTVGQMEELSQLVFKKFTNATPIERKIFWYEVLLEEPKPVMVFYYFNVLKFLIELYKSNPKSIDHPNGKNIDDILVEWIELLLFGFGKKPVLRYLWAFEGLVYRLTNRLLILSYDKRRKIASTVNQDIYELPEEEIAWNGPDPAREMIMIIESKVLQTLSMVIKLFYEKSEFKETLCYQTYKMFKDMVEKIEKDTDEAYWKLKEELGNKWSTLCSYEFTNHYYDGIFSGTCSILRSEPDILKKLPDNFKNRIELVASIRIEHKPYFKKDTKIANFADDCCKILNIKPDEVKISKSKVEEYFDPKKDPYSFNI